MPIICIAELGGTPYWVYPLKNLREPPGYSGAYLDFGRKKSNMLALVDVPSELKSGAIASYAICLIDQLIY